MELFCLLLLIQFLKSVLHKQTIKYPMLSDRGYAIHDDLVEPVGCFDHSMFFITKNNSFIHYSPYHGTFLAPLAETVGLGCMD